MNPAAERPQSLLDVTATPLGALVPTDADPLVVRAASTVVDAVVRSDGGVQAKADDDDGDYALPHRVR